MTLRAIPLRPNFAGAVSISPSLRGAMPPYVGFGADFGQLKTGNLNRRSAGSPDRWRAGMTDSRCGLNQNAGATHDRGIQEIRAAGKRRRSRHRGDHRRRLRCHRSLVGDIMSPIIGAVTGGYDFSNHFLPLSSKVTADSLVEAKKQGAVLAWGNFLNFIINAWVLFLVVKLMNQLMQSEAPKAPALTKQETLLAEIRDLLKREQR